MGYRVLALKYRPAAFGEVVGQKAVVTTLQNALREKRIAHGYIFSGVRGVGKTTMARLFARALNCSDGPTPEPCGKCASCVEIPEGRAMDVFEIDGASNSGVDKMRELLDTVRYSPARDHYKVFIIDEFHQISRTAFNALLKTLEEPPPHVVFVMATTELGKVIPTILSRCQQFDFRRIPAPEIGDQLRKICKKEKVKAGDRTLALIARSAGGSMRDALTALDQVIAACGNTVSDEDARAVLGVIPDEQIDMFFEGVAGKDSAGLLGLISELADAGYDMVTFGSELHHAARRLLVARTHPEPAPILDLSAEEAESATALANRFEEDDLLRVLTIVEQSQSSLRFSPQPRFILEAMAVRLARLAVLAPIDELISRLDALASPGAEALPPAAAARSSSARPRPAASVRPLTGARPSAASAPKKKLHAASPTGEAGPAAPGPITSAAPTERGDRGDDPAGTSGTSGDGPVLVGSLFERVMTSLEERNPGLAASLSMAVEPREEDGALVIPFPKKASVFRGRIEDAENMKLLSGTASELAGRPVEIRVIGSDQPGSTGNPAASRQREVTDRALADPMVKKVMDVFQARVVDIQEKR